MSKDSLPREGSVWSEGTVLNPFTDFGFKYLFGTEKNKDLTIGFINIILKEELDSPIDEIEFLDKELIPSIEDAKRSVVDVLCRTKDGVRYLIEMQNQYYRHMFDRLIYYHCDLISDTVSRGDKKRYGDIKKVFTICLSNFQIERNGQIKNEYKMCNTKTGKVISNIIHIITLQLPCVNVKNIAKSGKDYESLLALLKLMTDRKMGITYNEFKKAVDEIDVSDKIKRYFMDLICKAALTRLTEKERQEYRDHYFAVTIDDVIESAREEGLEEGIKEGMEKGMEKGKAEGIRQVAKSLLAQGLSLETISQATGLSQKEISKLS